MVEICVPLHHVCCQCGVTARQVVKEWLRIQLLMNSRSLPFFHHVKPTWTFMLGRALWYPAVLSPRGDLKEEGFGLLRRHCRSQAGHSWVTLLGCQHWFVLHSCFARAPALQQCSHGREITSTPLLAPAQKGLIIPLLLSTLSTFGCTPSMSRAASLPNSHCSTLGRKTFRCHPGFVSLLASFPFLTHIF